MLQKAGNGYFFRFAFDQQDEPHFMASSSLER